MSLDQLADPTTKKRKSWENTVDTPADDTLARTTKVSAATNLVSSTPKAPELVNESVEAAHTPPKSAVGVTHFEDLSSDSDGEALSLDSGGLE